MQLYRTKNHGAVVEDGGRYYVAGPLSWNALFAREDLSDLLKGLVPTAQRVERLPELLPPADSQQVWAAGVTYHRSRTARMEESKAAGGGDFYDRVYDAERPELFFKAAPHQVVGFGGRVAIRKDSSWSAPEPELTLAVTPSGKIVGYTIGNDMSSRDIEGENPLYLPQAKVYDRSCALGPGIWVSDQPLPGSTEIRLEILRGRELPFSGSTTLAEMKRDPASLVEYLFRHNTFPQGCFLMTGTGIVPPDSFTLQPGDEIRITIEPIGTLVNTVGVIMEQNAQLHGKNLVGAALSAQGEKTFRGFNPRTSEWLEPPFHQATQPEIDAAMARAAEAAAPLRQSSREIMAGFLETIADELLGLGDALIERASRESGIDQQRLAGERTRTVNQIRLFAAVVKEGSWVDARIDPALPDRKPLPRPGVRRMLMPIGPVAVFGASNFPLAFSVAGGDTISALAARNPVVVKAHPAHPGTSELAAGAIARAVGKCGLADGAFSLVHGIDPDVSLALARHPLTRAVAFTGSLRAGRALFDAAAQRPEPIPVFAEMGSINPVFLLPGALAETPDDIARGLAASINLGVGQFCTCPGLVVGKNDPAFQHFAAKLGALFAQVAPGTMLHPGILKGYTGGIARAASVQGVTAYKSSLVANAAQTSATPVLLETDSVTWLNNGVLSEEIFGPASILVRSESKDELLKIACALPGSLTATVFGNARDLDDHRELIRILETKAGRLIFNGYPTGVEVTYAMHHGGPYPATTDPKFTSVGTAAILRFARPLCYQNFPEQSLPPELRDENTLGIWRMINGQLTKDNVA